MLSEFWGYLAYLFLAYGIFFSKIIKGIWDTWTPFLDIAFTLHKVRMSL